ncbi:MAG: class I SAM-dependent methyltransferase [Pedobacter sp.]
MTYMLNLIMNLAVLVVGCMIYLRVRKLHRQFNQMKKKFFDETDVHIRSHFPQMECLLGLYYELDLRKSLPLTRGWAGSPDFLWHLTRHARKNCPQVVVECGSGTSTLILARCLQLNGAGHVYSMDHDPVFAEKTRQELAFHGLSEWATVFDAPLQKHTLKGEEWLWYAPEVLPEGLGIDMLIIDGPPASTGINARYPVGPLLFPLINPGGAVFMDDYARPDETAISKLWRAEWQDFSFIDMQAEKGLLCMIRD